MNCPDVSRAVCEILNGEPPRLAHGNRYASGESPDTTLEWMGLRDVPEANKFHRPPGRDGDWSLDQAAYQKVRDALAGRPPGTHANIGVYYVGGGGHRFTAFVDENDAMKWLDAQPSDAARKLPEGSPEQLAQIQRDMVKHSNQVPLASHIQQLDFAVREPGGKWEGDPRRPTDPPASQTRFGAPRPIHGTTPDAPTPDLPNVPEGTPTPDVSNSSPAPGSSPTPDLADGSHAPGGSHAPDGPQVPDGSRASHASDGSRTPDTAGAPQAPGTPGTSPTPDVSRTPETAAARQAPGTPGASPTPSMADRLNPEGTQPSRADRPRTPQEPISSRLDGPEPTTPRQPETRAPQEPISSRLDGPDQPSTPRHADQPDTNAPDPSIADRLDGRSPDAPPRPHDPNTPEPQTPDAHAPDSRTPDSRTPESHAPGANASEPSITDRLDGRDADGAPTRAHEPTAPDGDGWRQAGHPNQPGQGVPNRPQQPGPGGQPQQQPGFGPRGLRLRAMVGTIRCTTIRSIGRWSLIG